MCQEPYRSGTSRQAVPVRKLHTPFDDFCDADEPERYLGVSLRTEEEVVLMRELGVALNNAAAEAPNDRRGVSPGR